MGRKCVVPFCRGGYKPSRYEGSEGKKVGVFQFPSDSELCAKWVEAIPRKNWHPTVNSGVCENHFIQTDFVVQSLDRNVCRVNRKAGRNLLRKRLMPTAVPSIFPTPGSFVRRVGAKGSLESIRQAQKMFCSVPGCKLAYGTMGHFPPHIQNFEIPSKIAMKQKWFEAVPNLKMKPDQEIRVCSLHFDSEDFEPGTSTTTNSLGHLKNDAVPHILPRIIKIPDVSCGNEKRSQVEGDNTTQAFKAITQGSYDLKSIKPWKFDFHDESAEKMFWLWERKLRTFISLTKDATKNDKFSGVKALKSFLTEEAQKKLDGLKLSDSHGSDIGHVLSALRLQAANQQHVVKARIKFNLRIQESNEEFDRFLIDLISLAQKCEFCDCCKDNLIRDRILAGHKDTEIINKMLKLPELNLQQAISLCRTEEQKSLLSDGEEQESSDESEHDNWNNEISEFQEQPSSYLETDLEVSNTLFKPSEDVPGKDNIGVTDERVIVAFQENDINSVIIISEKPPETDEAKVHKRPAKHNMTSKHGGRLRPGYDHTEKDGFDEYLEELGYNNFGIKDRFSCHQCNDEFISSTRYLNHVRSVHKPEATKFRGLDCKICSESFSLTKDLLKHNAEVHKDLRPHQCNMCPAKFNHKGHLRRHFMVLHKNIRPFECDSCPKRFGTRECLFSHKRSVHEIRACLSCDLKFENKKEWRNHVHEKHKAEKVHLCDSCGKSFSNKNILKGHQKRAHEGEVHEKPFKCPSCKMGFSHLHFLMMHVNKMRRRQCDEHLKLTSVNGIELQTEGFEVEPMKSKLMSASTLRCKLCKLSFISVQSLRSHVSTVHNQEKNYKCDDCQKNFSTQHILTLHQRSVHLGLKPYECSECPATFGQPTHLKRHTRVIHDGARDFSCDFCSKSYANKTDLLSHLRKIHHQDTSMRCPHCDLTFDKRKFLLSHLNSVHEKDLSE